MTLGLFCCADGLAHRPCHSVVSVSSSSHPGSVLSATPRRRTWRTCVLLAVALHSAAVLYSWFLRDARSAQLSLTSQVTDAPLLVSLEEASASPTVPGGGSQTPGPNEEAITDTPRAPRGSLRPVNVEAKALPSNSQAEITADALEASDYAEAPLLNSVNENWHVSDGATGPRRVSEIQSLGADEAKPGPAKVYARYGGNGPGTLGGPGGPGRGFGKGAKTVSENTAFGGSSGSFSGRVCFIPEGTTSLQSLGACQTQAMLYTDHIDISRRHFDQGVPGISKRTEWFSILYEGSFTLRAEGVYAFKLVSDDGSLLEVDGRRLIDNDGIHSAVGVVQSVPLEAGPHSFKLLYFQGPRNEVALQLFVTPPGEPERPFSAAP